MRAEAAGRTGKAGTPSVGTAKSVPYVALKLPFILLACGSQTKRYVRPFRKVTVQVVVPRNRTVVRLFTPRPDRWKLCMADRSRTTIR